MCEITDPRWFWQIDNPRNLIKKKKKKGLKVEHLLYTTEGDGRAQVDW